MEVGMNIIPLKGIGNGVI